jgi:hypothetical protein
MTDADFARLLADLTLMAARLAEIDARDFGRPTPLPSSQPTPNETAGPT